MVEATRRRLNHAIAPIASPGDRARRDAGVKGNESALMFDGECQQIYISDLFGADDLAPVGNARMQQADFIGPELMRVGGCRLPEPLGDESHR